MTNALDLLRSMWRPTSIQIEVVIQEFRLGFEVEDREPEPVAMSTEIVLGTVEVLYAHFERLDLTFHEGSKRRDSLQTVDALKSSGKLAVIFMVVPVRAVELDQEAGARNNATENVLDEMNLLLLRPYVPSLEVGTQLHATVTICVSRDLIFEILEVDIDFVSRRRQRTDDLGERLVLGFVCCLLDLFLFGQLPPASSHLDPPMFFGTMATMEKYSVRTHFTIASRSWRWTSEFPKTAYGGETMSADNGIFIFKENDTIVVVHHWLSGMPYDIIEHLDGVDVRWMDPKSFRRFTGLDADLQADRYARRIERRMIERQ